MGKRLLTQQQIEEARQLRDKLGIGKRRLAELFNVSSTTIWENVYLTSRIELVQRQKQKEIYEGDILRALMTEPDFGAVYHDVGEVVYHPEAAQFVMQKGKIVARISNNVEIIGNIYQNPELLNK